MNYGLPRPENITQFQNAINKSSLPTSNTIQTEAFQLLSTFCVLFDFFKNLFFNVLVATIITQHIDKNSFDNTVKLAFHLCYIIKDACNTLSNHTYITTCPLICSKIWLYFACFTEKVVLCVEGQQPAWNALEVNFHV